MHKNASQTKQLMLFHSVDTSCCITGHTEFEIKKWVCVYECGMARVSESLHQ